MASVLFCFPFILFLPSSSFNSLLLPSCSLSLSFTFLSFLFLFSTPFHSLPLPSLYHNLPLHSLPLPFSPFLYFSLPLSSFSSFNPFLPHSILSFPSLPYFLFLMRRFRGILVSKLACLSMNPWAWVRIPALAVGEQLTQLFILSLHLP